MWGSVYLFAIASSVTKIKNNLTLKTQCALFYTGESIGYVYLLCIEVIFVLIKMGAF